MFFELPTSVSKTSYSLHKSNRHNKHKNKNRHTLIVRMENYSFYVDGRNKAETETHTHSINIHN